MSHTADQILIYCNVTTQCPVHNHYVQADITQLGQLGVYVYNQECRKFSVKIIQKPVIAMSTEKTTVDTPTVFML